MTVKAHNNSRLALRGAAVCIFAVVLLGLLAPAVDAARYSQPIKNALEAALGRKVEFQKVHLTLFAGPGFSLEEVTIQEDPHYGLGPFAHVGTLQARLRIDKLLVGKVQFSSLRLEEPSLNLVKRNDGTWNIVELLSRLSALRAGPLNLFPAIEVSDGRIDFQFGIRKTVLYIAESQVSIYPERSGKLLVQFSGSPARTDRAGTGFGHLRGRATWSTSNSEPSAGQLRADVTLDPSNLSELATLFEGHDIGVHGIVSSQGRIEGPLSALRITGELRLENVRRWDLIPSQGEDWRIRYRGQLDAPGQRFELETVAAHPAEATPVALQVKATEFLRQPSWSVLARLKEAPAENLLPLGKRMGLALPDGLTLSGTLDGVIGYSNRSGLAGGVAIHQMVAKLPNLPPLRTAQASASISPQSIHFDPAIIDTGFPGTLKASGDYFPGTRRVSTAITAGNVPVKPLKAAMSAWFGQALSIAPFEDGELTGQFTYSHDGLDAATWSGQVLLEEASLRADGVAPAVEHFNGRIAFDNTTLDIPHFTAMLANKQLAGEYHYSEHAKRTEHLRLDLAAADLTEIEAALEPSLHPHGLLARLRFGHRAVPSWMASRYLEGDLNIAQFSVGTVPLGRMRTRLLWDGSTVHLTAMQLKLPAGDVRARGSLNLAGYAPRYRFTATASSVPWKGGLLNAEATMETSGLGPDALQNLTASGTFTGQRWMLSTDDSFNRVAGKFAVSFGAGWPNVRLSNVQAADGDDDWDGQAISQSDGKLIFDLEHDGHQRRVVSTLEPDTTPSNTPAVARVGQP